MDVEAGDRSVALLRERGAIAGGDLLGRLGGFGAALAIPAGYREPVLVSATDGVGTKLEIARRLGRLDTVGRDLVAMCADDVACHGAKPLFFLDYVAVGKLVPERVAALVGGVAAGCTDAGCALVGGETAEHPGVMDPDAFDLAGFCVGIVERDRLIDGGQVRAGDAIIGIASSGLHSNGYSLVRRLVERHALDLAEPWDEVLARYGVSREGRDVSVGPETTLGDVLLTPTRIYALDILALRDALEARGLRLGGIAHVTGGGLPTNLPRAVPASLGVCVDIRTWPEPTLMQLLRSLGGLSGPEVRATFNAGIGMAVVVEPTAVAASLDWLSARALQAWRIGVVVPAAETAPSRYLEVES